METKNIDLKILIASTLAVPAVEVVMTSLARAVDIRPLLLVAGARIIQIFLVLFIAAFLGQGRTSLGLGPSTIRPGLKSGLLWSACFGLAAVVILPLLHLFGLNPQTIIRVDLPGDYTGLALYFFVGGLIAPVAEEIFFRGVVYGFFRRWGAPAAVVISTLIFAGLHLFKTPVPITQLAGGLVFGLAYEKTGSLAAPITIHALGNLALFGLSHTLGLLGG